MGEYLELVTDSLSDNQLRAMLVQELAGYPGLLSQLHVGQRTISTKLATCEHVFFTFEEMVALYRFIRKHADVLRYGPSHEYNATPDEILRDRSSLYLGPFGQTPARTARQFVDAELIHRIEHAKVWRKTKHTLSKNGRWYHRRVRRDETSGIAGNPNGYRTECPATSRPFRAITAGFAWDASTNQGRRIYRCPSCDVLFNLGETPTPEFADLARQLASPLRPSAETGPGTATSASNHGRLPAGPAPAPETEHR